MGLFFFGFLVIGLFNGLVGSMVELVLTGEIRDPRIFGWTLGFLVERALSVCICVFLVLWISKLKRMITPLNVVLALLAGFLAMVAYNGLGLLIPAFLTMRQPRGEN